MADCDPLLRQRLLDLLAEMGPENIWRDVYDAAGIRLARGHEDQRITAPEDFAAVDFQGKTVLDLGCNLGSYVFLAARGGAAQAMGVDSDPLAIRGCRLLAQMYSMDNTKFVCADFIEQPPGEQFDLVLLINFIGRRSLVKGIQPVLDVCRRTTRESLILSVREKYHIQRGLRSSAAHLASLYGADYVQDEFFLATAFVRDYLQLPCTWISPEYDDKTLKPTYLFQAA